MEMSADIDERENLIDNVFYNPEFAGISKQDVVKIYDAWNEDYEKVHMTESMETGERFFSNSAALSELLFFMAHYM